MTFEELGAALCAERERRGLSLDDVAAHLKISTRLIQALESGDLSALPHPAYTKGFLRAYASYMALDPEAVAEVAHALQPAAATECTVMGGDEDLRSNPAILRHGARQGIAGWLHPGGGAGRWRLDAVAAGRIQGSDRQQGTEPADRGARSRGSCP